MMYIKICGITTLSDALAAVDAGADMIGYNFYPKSKRYLTPEACADIQNALARRNILVRNGVLPTASRTTQDDFPEVSHQESSPLKNAVSNGVVIVGVFVNASQQEIEQTATFCNLGYAQLSGDEDMEFARGLKVPWFKAIRPRSGAEAEREGKAFGRRMSPGLLVDSFRPGQYGGTGEVGDWGLASALAGSFSILLAGGLTPENVESAILQVRPWGVDVASGVESAPGVKDHEKIRLFVRRAKEVI